jgi:hypothetical protein
VICDEADQESGEKKDGSSRDLSSASYKPVNGLVGQFDITSNVTKLLLT